MSDPTSIRLKEPLSASTVLLATEPWNPSLLPLLVANGVESFTPHMSTRVSMQRKMKKTDLCLEEIAAASMTVRLTDQSPLGYVVVGAAALPELQARLPDALSLLHITSTAHTTRTRLETDLQPIQERSATTRFLA
jgi:hypothetical protein